MARKEIAIVINKSEISAGTRGSSLGPEAIITAARNDNNPYFSKYSKHYVTDMNQMLDQKIKFPHAKRINGLLKVFESVIDKVSGTLKDNKLPIVLSADHGSAGGTIAAIKSVYPNKRLGVIWIDAHSDIHSPYTTISGNMHGMPLAAALSIDNKEMQRNNLLIEEVDYWEKLKNIGNVSPKINSEDLVFIAVRDTEIEEDFLIKNLNIKNHTVDQIRQKGVKSIVNDVLNQLKDCDLIYISFDVDSMDPEWTSYGTGLPVLNGLKRSEANALLNAFSADERLCCLEITEINPCLDKNILNTMAAISFGLLQSLTNIIESK